MNIRCILTSKFITNKLSPIHTIYHYDNNKVRSCRGTDIYGIINKITNM